MMLSETTNFIAANTGFQAKFLQALEATKTWYETLSMVVPSSGPQENYQWAGTIATMKERKDESQFTKLRGYEYTLKNITLQAGIEMDLTDLEDDRIGHYGPQIATLAERAKRHPDTLLFGLMMAGFSNTLGNAYDGQFFFDNDHKDGDGPTQSNVTTAALDATSYAAGWAAMMGFKAEDGSPFGVQPTHLVVGPALRSAARALLVAERGANGSSNIEAGTCELIVSPYIAGNKWFLYDLSKPLKPFVTQMRVPNKLEVQDKADGDNFFLRGKVRYQVRGRYNCGFAFWQTAYGSNAA
jgi:phage major head subunit gpT-like protein